MKAADDRDRAVERLLQQSFKTPAGPSAACLDAETLAAWADGGLSAAARATVESHVADCARCQSVIATAARIEAIAPARVKPAPRRWLAWLVPLTAAAAAVAIWVAVPRGPDALPPQQAATARQSAPATLPETPPTAAPLREQATPEPQSAAAKRDQPDKDLGPARELRKDADRTESDRLKQESQAADAGAASTDKLTAATAPATAPPSSPVVRQTLQERSNSVAAAEKAVAGSAVALLARAVRWRISGTALEGSTDGGSTWSRVATGVTADLTAVSTPSGTVCWVVGRGGVVLRTTDGRNFSRVAFPEVTDLSAVQATDERSATVTAGDGRIFTTSDGGATWQSR